MSAGARPDEPALQTVVLRDLPEDMSHRPPHLPVRARRDVAHEALAVGVEGGGEGAALLRGGRAAGQLALGGRLGRRAGSAGRLAAGTAGIRGQELRLHLEAQHGALVPRALRVRGHVVRGRVLADPELGILLPAGEPRDHAVAHRWLRFFAFLGAVALLARTWTIS